MPRADVAIFADTQDEEEGTYSHLWNLAGRYGHIIPIHVVTFGKLSHDLVMKTNGKRARIPFFVRNENGTRGMLRRQCTSAYKIEPIEKHLRALLGLKKGERAVGRVKVRALLGISLDECDRMKTNPTRWIDDAFPLVDANLTLRDCIKICQEHLDYEPVKSACVFCPFKSDAQWRHMKTNNPAAWGRAVKLERDFRASDRLTGMRGEVFLHPSLQVLDRVDFGESQKDFFTNECAGICGV